MRFTAQPGYYLYRDKLAFRVVGDNGFEVGGVDLPEGTIKDDPEFGPVEVYFGQIEVPVHIHRPAGPEQTISLEADYQGCRDGDICYPPQTSRVELLMAASNWQARRHPRRQWFPGSAIPPVSEQDALAQMLLKNPAGALFAFFIAGILLAFTPCVFPMVPILSGIIAGHGDRMTTSKAFWLSLVYVLAMAVTYTVAGVLAGLFGQNLQAVFQNPWILGFFIAIFIALAFSMFGFFELQLPASLQTRLAQASNQQQGGSLTGVAVMGFLSALIVGPCVAPPLAAALIVIGASGSALLGGAALFALSMGMGVPLILFGVSAGKLVPKAGPWMDSIKAVFGIASAGAGHLDAGAYCAGSGDPVALGCARDGQRCLPRCAGTHTRRALPDGIACGNQWAWCYCCWERSKLSAQPAARITGQSHLRTCEPAPGPAMLKKSCSRELSRWATWKTR